MPFKTQRKIEMHDAAGYETEMFEFSDDDDGYGNNMEFGDQSVQRMVERGARYPWWGAGPEDIYYSDRAPEAYDKEPFQSQAQVRKFGAMEARGEIPSGTTSRWMRHTRGGYEGLPGRASRHHRG